MYRNYSQRTLMLLGSKRYSWTYKIDALKFIYKIISSNLLFNVILLCSAVLANYPKTGPSRDPRMTSMFRRGTIFATFFLSLLGGGLVCAALVTQHWVEARAWRTSNPQESAGRVHFGLLQGKKELNVAYGWRTYHVSGMLVFFAFLFVQLRLYFAHNHRIFFSYKGVVCNLEWYAV